MTRIAILADSEVGTVVIRLLILMPLAVLGFFAVMRLRRWLKEDDTPAGAIGFTLSDLRRLHQTGHISTEEYEKARSQMHAAGKSMTEGIDPLARMDQKKRRNT